MQQNPTLSSQYVVRVVQGEGVVLLSEDHDQIMCGPAYEHLVPLLTGEHTADQIVDRLGRVVHPTEAYYALYELENQGALVQGSDHDAATSAGSGRLGGAPAVALSSSLSVVVDVVGGVPIEQCFAALERSGCTVSDSGDIRLVFTDHYLRTDLVRVNERALQSGQPWILIKPLGRVVWVGPCFVPGETACWMCLHHRLARNRPAMWFHLRKNGEPYLRGTVHSRKVTEVAVRMFVSLFAERIGSAADRQLTSSIATCDTARGTQRRHAVMRRPQCPVCGDPDRYARQLLQYAPLASQAKGFTADGGHRTISPEATLSQFAGLVDPLTGVVGGIGKVPVQGSNSLHVYIAHYNGGYPDETLPRLWESNRKSSGKGVTDAQARVSALGEAIERYSAVFQGDEPRRLRRFTDLGEQAIHPNACMLFSDAQYRHREGWNKGFSIGKHVPVPFDESAPIEWTPVWSLTRQMHRFLPTMYLYYDYPAAPNNMFCLPDSNGCAAGNNREEAILQGFLELVERDCVAVWWYNRVQLTQVDLETVEDSYSRDVREYYRMLGRQLWVLDVTSDLGVPCFAAVSRRPDCSPEQIVLGFGAHLDAGLALRRALTELNQMLAVVNAPGRPSFGTEIDSWVRTANVEEHSFLLPSDQAPRAISDFSSQSYNDLRDEIEWCRQLVEALGMEVLVHEQTRPDIGVPVTKVIVPGLRHFWARFAPGRLYDVPVSLGWVERPIEEAHLNPVPVFF